VLIAVLTHPLLDWCTTYGTQLFAPLTDRRYAIDAVPILDIFYTPILILTLAACWLARKLSSGEARGITLRIGWAGFLLSVSYLAAGRVLHDRAIAKALAVHPVRNVVRADAYPSVGTILLWRVVIETPDDWRAVRVHQFGQPSSYRMSVARRAANAWIDRARALPVARTFDWFAMGRTRAQYSRLDDTHVVELQDMRYGLRPDSMEGLWAVRVIFSGRGDVLEADFLRRHRGHRFRELLRAAWSDIWNP